MNGTMNERNPYVLADQGSAAKRGRLARAGATLAEMLVWLVIMAALTVGMIWLLGTTSAAR